MARWSDAIHLKENHHWKKDLNHPGVYEIGFVRNGEFNPKHVGKGSNTVYERLSKHWNERGSRKIAEYYQSKAMAEQRDMLYFHFIITENYGVMEQNLLARFKIGRDGGIYEWNLKYE